MDLTHYDVTSDSELQINQKGVEQLERDKYVLSLHRNVIRRVACLKTWEEASIIKEIYKLLEEHRIPHLGP